MRRHPEVERRVVFKKLRMTHELKTWPEYFEAISCGDKTFELRKNDRNFQVGDTLHLREWKFNGFSAVNPDQKVGEYTGNEIYAQVTYILPYNPNLEGILHDSVIMSISII